MAESSAPGRSESPGSGSLADETEEEEEEEREPLLPRIAWAPPRRGAPGGAVRLVEAGGEEGAAFPREAGDEEPLLPHRDAPRCPSRGPRGLRNSPTDPDRIRPVGSGATRLLTFCPRRSRSPCRHPAPLPVLAPAWVPAPHPAPGSVLCLTLALPCRKGSSPGIPSNAQDKGPDAG